MFEALAQVSLEPIRHRRPLRWARTNAEDRLERHDAPLRPVAGAEGSVVATSAPILPRGRGDGERKFAIKALRYFCYRVVDLRPESQLRW